MLRATSAHRLPPRLSALLFGASLAACGGSTEVQVIALRLDLAASPLSAIGETVTATATALDADGAAVAGITIFWSSSDPSVASVASGVVTAQGNGTAFIVASAEGVRDSAAVVVDQVPAGIQVSHPYDTLFALRIRARLTAQVTDANGVTVPTSHVTQTWTSSNEAVATVDSEGRVTPLGAGTVTISAAAGSLNGGHTLHIAPAWQVEVDVPLAEALQWALEDALPATGSFGVSASVILPDGREWIGTTGWARPDARLRPAAQTAPGSIAKSAAGALLLTVIDDGLAGLDDTLGDLLPAFPNVSPDATLRQILNNSSGIANYPAHPSFGSAVSSDTSRLWTHEDLMQSFVGPAEFTPGLRYKSSNTGFILALMVAASLAGDDHRTLMRKRVFEPLGLDAGMHMPPWEPSPPEAVAGWWVDGNGKLVDFVPFLSTSLLSARGIGLMASSSTMAHFFRAFVDGNLLSPALRSEALTAIPDDGLIPGQDGAGLGLRRYSYLGGRQWGHSGAVSNGSGIVFHDVDLDVTVAVMFNAHPAAHQNVHFTLAPELLRLVRDSGS